jgi:hypothetical protein
MTGNGTKLCTVTQLIVPLLIYLNFSLAFDSCKKIGLQYLKKRINGAAIESVLRLYGMNGLLARKNEQWVETGILKEWEYSI